MVETIFRTNIDVPAFIIQDFGIGIPFKVSAYEAYRIDLVVSDGLGSFSYSLPTLKLNNISLLELRALTPILLPPFDLIGEWRDF